MSQEEEEEEEEEEGTCLGQRCGQRNGWKGAG